MLTATLLAQVVVLVLLYGVCLAWYRLCLSPIARFPGRKLAAISFLYEFYYDIVLGGQYTNEIARMHEKYGPIIRINPYELHIKDPNFYDTIYCMSSKRVDKWAWQMRGFATPKATFNALEHNLHQARRAPLAALFSKRAVSQLEPLIAEYVEKLLSRFEDLRGSKAVNLFYAYSALTGDIINAYSFGASQGFLESPDFAADWYELFMTSNRHYASFKHFGSVNIFFKILSQWLGLSVFPVQLVQLQRHLEKQLAQVKDALAGNAKPVSRTIFHEIIGSDLPPAEKSIERLVDESVSVMAAGTATTADTLAVTSFHIINSPLVLKQLQDELGSNNSQILQELERLPYLTAVIKEGLRVSYGVTSRLPRIFVNDSVRFNEWTIPRGTPISMSGQLMHDDPDAFAEPEIFNPDRWTNSNSGRRLEKYLVPFGKGTRQCLGVNLAYAELYLTLAAVFTPGKFTFKLFETTERDVEVVADFFNPGHRPDSKGIRVTIS